MKFKKIGFLFATSALALALAACGGEETAEDTLNDGKLVIGVTAGLHEEITEIAADIAAENGLEVDIRVFSDYVLPNTALVEGDLDINNFQTQPFLDTFNTDRGEELVSVGNTILNPMGIYSSKYASMEEVPDGATFALPNDATNGGRALVVLADAGYITLKEGVSINASIFDVVDNPHNYEFIELEAAQLPTQLAEVDFAAINTNFALEAGLNPKNDSIILESSDSPYVNKLVVRPGEEDSEDLKKFIEAYQTDEVRNYIIETYEGAVIPGF
ncbi:MetQ/NlpA family ABC transporter substrate-binding protein [Solibacillus sp. FSL H8-0538]|uniref:MetQ/NlpA family ABC transporter substrate-binding protein n=1 Tax=Solibacillus sp. FSL H8-0538 TaxID=2921400 RepID=UPI0030FC0DC1